MKVLKVSGMPSWMDRLDAVIHCAEDGEPNGVHFSSPGAAKKAFFVLS